MVRRVIRLNACVWGGRYNPIIPFVEGGENRWTGEWDRSPGIEVTRGYINFFEPDILVEAAEGMASRLGWGGTESHFGFPRIISVDEFYTIDDRGRVDFAAGIDILNVMKHLYDREYKYQRRRKVPFALIEPDADSTYFDVFIGAYPKDPALKDITDTYLDVFEPEVFPASADTAVRMLETGLAGPNWITRSELEEGLGRGRLHHSILIFDPSDADDVIDAWNLRLINRDFVPINIAWLPEHVPALRQQIETVHRPIPGNVHGVNFSTNITFASSISDERALALISQHFQGLADGAYSWGREPGFWRAIGRRDRWRETRLGIVAKTESFNVEITADGYAKFPSLAPDFYNATKTYQRAWWINVISPSASGGNEQVATVYPSNVWEPDHHGLGIASRLTVTREGWTLAEQYATGSSLLRPQSGRDSFIRWFKEQGVEAHPSEAGQVAAQIIRAAGNLLACGMFADAATLQLLNEMAESHAQPTRDGKSVRAVGPDRAINVSRVEQHFNRRAKTGFGFWAKLDAFLKRSVFRAGLNVQCPTCSHYNWIDLDEAGYSLVCSRCLKSFKFGQAPEDLRKVQWFYRLIGPFAAPDYARGGYAVALTLRCLTESQHHELTWSTGLILRELEQEIDFAAWYRRGARMAGEQDEPTLVIGEAKSFGKNAIGDDVVQDLRRVAERFPEAVLIVSTLKTISDYSYDEIKRLTELANWGRSRGTYTRPKNPLIVLTGTELLCEYSIPQAWKKVGGRAAQLIEPGYVDISDLYTLAELTQQLYLGLPTFYDDYSAQLIATRARLINQIAGRAGVARET